MNQGIDFGDRVNTVAKVLTQGDTFNLRLPLRGKGNERTIERHLRSYDPTSWSIIQGHMLQTAGFVDAVFARIQTIEGVQFEVRELALLLLELPGGESIRHLLEPHIAENSDEVA